MEKNTTLAQVVLAFVAASPRLCELNDKLKSVGLDLDEQEEINALRRMIALAAAERAVKDNAFVAGLYNDLRA